MVVETVNPKLTQKQITKELEFSDSSIKRYRSDLNMNNPYPLQKPKDHQTQIQPQKTSKDLKIHPFSIVFARV